MSDFRNLLERTNLMRPRIFVKSASKQFLTNLAKVQLQTIQHAQLITLEFRRGCLLCHPALRKVSAAESRCWRLSHSGSVLELQCENNILFVDYSMCNVLQIDFCFVCVYVPRWVTQILVLTGCSLLYCRLLWSGCWKVFLTEKGI